jgi:fructuronate reductase
MMERLHADALQGVNSRVRLPRYDREALRPGIVHIGLGAFHRAHQAFYTEQAIAASGGDWGIIGVSVRSAAVSRQLRPQGCLYSVMHEDAHGDQLQVVGAVVDVLVAPQEPEKVVAAIADSRIKVITLTITEKGYSLSTDGLSLNTEDEAVRADLDNPLRPATAIGLLARGLKARVATGDAPLTIISCDNLSKNSHRLRTVLNDYLAHTFPEIQPWVEDNVTFPCSMVDRIVPASTEQQKQRQAQLLGLVDEAAVCTEPFNQWIIEDCFAAGRPDWESVGVKLVSDVLPYEEIKLRLLNASHSAIAYCGLLAGLETVDQVMADPQLRRFVERLMAEDLMPVLLAPADFDLCHYRDELLARFSNPCLGHRCQQIAMDGSEKISQRWLPTLQSASNCNHLVQALSAWCYFILQTELPIDDPCSSELMALRYKAAPPREQIDAVLSCARVNSGSVGDYSALRESVLQNLRSLHLGGVRNMLGTLEAPANHD